MRDLGQPGLNGLLLVTFFAAFMSTLSTQMNWGASYLVRDVYQRFMKPDATERQLTHASRGASLIILIAGAIAAIQMANVSIDAAWKILLALGAGYRCCVHATLVFGGGLTRGAKSHRWWDPWCFFLSYESVITSAAGFR